MSSPDVSKVEIAGAGAASAPGENDSLITVALAFTSNLVIAIAKTVVAVITGSASMLAESAHSWADTGNEIFLVVADRRGRAGRDAEHPRGYGAEAYIWSMIAAFGLFTVGAVVSIMHGISELRSPEPGGDFLLSYLVLVLSFVFEGISFLRSYQQSRRAGKRRDLGTIDQVLTGSDPTVRAVFAEDAAALLGLIIAFVGILLHQLTGSPMWDAIGSIVVGLLLAVVAILLIDRNRRFLVGESVDPVTRGRVLALLVGNPDVDRVTYLHVEWVGPMQIFLVAAVDVRGNQDEEHVAVLLRRVEAEIEKNPRIVEAVLTLSAPGDPELTG
ncbi:cation diffusion facilitator family transporter [Williamsia sterculiae]|uniref:Cation diffusion facilitator family transporter n=1 Tax=Williamsia sterculiae TaxID=1344003 RepID=A0A1N7DGH3_9NOCA|nr:cation diffusion facilitator family transporter [Williamsia sterculiae]SIR74918.1 cation diffusion facilitator family transporter [Williamsia sterculiae]